MIYLDTHVIIWLYGDASKKLSTLAESLISDNDICISPLVRLELKYLYEIGRLGSSPDQIIEYLVNQTDLNICQKDFYLIIEKAMSIEWTRDVFDRLIVANAMIDENILISKDHKILANYSYARW
ncbi:PIN domain-containing protein [Anabaena cylindrica FACHB-243]|uniref:PilT protein domain protein n=1 Tax=Anabaena cylindrica (strain ATCC 27899 / PCC 7122) TaxID=272123 RepID=K9ZMZ6_ANACC|nr:MULTISPECIES: PIN domain-containing protein [Anabaena]AFZ60159.1 PilT protein domain protein [Anabaena cylindrica PCC 7122]MBD2417787.1 PIN domain-containing protein [Anabaena cylindrica FACHB-243]MBY5285311.1 type II toxin-antitoxin system VapC family toxin [Anabaena sp. CCAP 1446/1C]MBY5311769.1 type II toxin-antitoxin system VapC family toxin [Anabaena sp. CCAP 1446/1C]MCM2404702.1 PIN domain-containing protein [Anabaena sp. CCAP 1446/1C]